MKHRLFDWIVYVNQHDKGVQCYSLNHVQLFATPWAIACQAPLSTGFSRQDTGVGCHSFLQGIFPSSQRLNPSILHCGQILYCLSYQGFSGGKIIETRKMKARMGSNRVSQQMTRQAIIITQVIKMNCIASKESFGSLPLNVRHSFTKWQYNNICPIIFFSSNLSDIRMGKTREIS